MLILHIITGLGRGGAEANLFRIVSSDVANSHVVISLTDFGEYGDKLVERGVDVLALGMSASLRGVWQGVVALRSHVASNSPDVVQTWLYKADFLGGLAAWFAGHRAIVWSIRSSPPSLSFAKPSTFLSFGLLVLFSWWVPSRIVACGEVLRKSHARLGYRSSKIIVVPNGLAESEWIPSAKARSIVRERLQIGEAVLTFGQIANFHPIKRHSLLLKAFKKLSEEAPDVHLILAGQDVDDSNQELVSLVDRLSLNSRVTLAGKQSDSGAILNGLDVLVSPSASEGFPNVVLEALFMGRPCVVSDAGESARVLGPGGWVFAPENVKGLSRVLIDAARIGDDSLRRIGSLGREHAIRAYSEERMVTAYQKTWSEVYAQTFRRAEG